ncbi:MAG: hypothetical protein KME17_22870 [Cyanosarcina radialis HA8281-LM2]|nr:hypothetical protein [Cyanosarcina radialis HA8281-LM2]
MAIRKYFSEFGINMLARRFWLLQEDSLSHLNEYDEFNEDPPHIYMIVRQPRVSLEPESFLIDGQFMRAKFKVQTKNDFRKGEFMLTLPSAVPKLHLKCDYPYTEFSLYDEFGVEFGKYKVALLLAKLNCLYADLSELISLDVLYVGQSYGVKGSRTAATRLKNHSTLQNIYFESIKRSPDRDIWLLFISFNQVKFITMDPKQQIYETSLKQDYKHIKRVMNTDISEQQKINFTEAALIRYFQPEYNKIFKKSFPNSAHQTYSECYELDINSIIVELQTQDIGYMIKSDRVPPQWGHLAIFNIHSSEERKSMFELAGLIESDES